MKMTIASAWMATGRRYSCIECGDNMNSLRGEKENMDVRTIITLSGKPAIKISIGGTCVLLTSEEAINLGFDILKAGQSLTEGEDE